jgi:hypothetical protein
MPPRFAAAPIVCVVLLLALTHATSAQMVEVEDVPVSTPQSQTPQATEAVHELRSLHYTLLGISGFVFVCGGILATRAYNRCRFVKKATPKETEARRNAFAVLSDNSGDDDSDIPIPSRDRHHSDDDEMGNSPIIKDAPLRRAAKAHGAARSLAPTVVYVDDAADDEFGEMKSSVNTAATTSG